MLFRTVLSAGLLAGCLPLASKAQTAPASPRFYAGVGASLLTGAPFSHGSFHTTGPSLTGGVQLNPRWALQVGAALGWHKQTSSSIYYPATGTPTVETNENYLAMLTVPVLARYTFTPSTKHFHVDGLMGLSLLHITNRNTYTSTTYGTTSDAYTSSFNNTLANLALGPAVRCELTPHVELTAEAVVSVVVSEWASRFTDRLLLNWQLGAHYNFGRG